MSEAHPLGTTAPASVALQPLTPGEQERRTELEARIEAGFATLIEVGKALQEIRDSKLYRNTHETWSDYLAERWGTSRQQASNWILGWPVAERLSTRVDTENPLTERVIREIRRLDDPTLQEVALQIAEQTRPGPLTAGWVSACVSVIQGLTLTAGHVDTGNGSMTALTAAITQEAYETMQRQREHIRHNQEQRGLMRIVTNVKCRITKAGPKGRLLLILGDLNLEPGEYLISITRAKGQEK